VIRIDIFHTQHPLGTAEASLYRADLEHAGYRGGLCLRAAVRAGATHRVGAIRQPH
jgi:hypothetical protein